MQNKRLTTKLTIGLTGGIGSGKSTVADYFAQYGVTIIDTDRIAHALTAPHTTHYQKIIEHFGPEAHDRSALRRIIFNDPHERHWLEALLHHDIMSIVKTRMEQSTGIYTMVVIPLLIELQLTAYFDRIVVVDAPVDLQYSRVLQRSLHNDLADNIIDVIDKMIETQCSREKRLSYADDIILNDGSLEHLKQQVDQLHLKFVSLLHDAC